MDNFDGFALEQKIWGKEKEDVSDALNSMWISGGYYVDTFEFFLRTILKQTFVNVPLMELQHYKGLLAIGVKPGDEIILPGFGYIANANVALTMGLKPVFADIDKFTWCLDIKSVENLINKNTKAIIEPYIW